MLRVIFAFLLSYCLFGFGPINNTGYSAATGTAAPSELKSRFDSWISQSQVPRSDVSGFYADFVDYYRVKGMPKSKLLADKAGFWKKYERLEIRVENVTFSPGPGDWWTCEYDKHFDATKAGSGDHYTGHTRSRLVFQKVRGTWLISTEKDDKAVSTNGGGTSQGKGKTSPLRKAGVDEQGATVLVNVDGVNKIRQGLIEVPVVLVLPGRSDIHLNVTWTFDLNPTPFRIKEADQFAVFIGGAYQGTKPNPLGGQWRNISNPSIERSALSTALANVSQ